MKKIIACLAILSSLAVFSLPMYADTNTTSSDQETNTTVSEDQNGTMPGQGEDTNGTMPGQGQDQNGTMPGQPGQGEDQNGTMPGQGEDQNGTLPGQDTCPPNTTCNIETPQPVHIPPQDFPIKQSNNANAEVKVFKAKVGDKEATIGLEIKSESSTQTSQTKPEIKSVQVIEPSKKTIETENKKITIPFGLLSYTIDGLESGATVEITLVFPRDDRINGYMKYIDGKWKNVPVKTITHEGEYTLITLSLTDGGEFDDDGSANGSITDPGGPVVLPQTVQVPMSKSALLLLALLLALLPFARRKIS